MDSGAEPDRLAAGVDALLAQVAARMAMLTDAPASPETSRIERQLLDDLERIARHLRADADACHAALSGNLESMGALADSERATDHDAARQSGAGVDPLTRFAIRRGTDKWGPHFYTPVYHELFDHLRQLPIRLLEIGVGGHDSAQTGGASLLMWADYFPHARIVGIDVAEKKVQPHPRVTVLRGSQDDAGFLTALVADHGPFDIVVDDGSHRPEHVAASFDLLFPRMTERGIYAIEDVQTAFWPRFGGSPADGAATMALAQAVLRGINQAEIQVEDPAWAPSPAAAAVRAMRAFHNLLVFYRGGADEPSTRAYDAGNTHVQRALAVMERELANDPTPEGLAQLARTYSLAGLHEGAQDAVRRGLERWPDHLVLLLAGYKAARRMGNPRVVEAFAARLQAVAGEDPYVRGLIARPANA